MRTVVLQKSYFDLIAWLTENVSPVQDSYYELDVETGYFRPILPNTEVVTTVSEGDGWVIDSNGNENGWGITINDPALFSFFVLSWV
jgi:hypothetical protein